MSEKCKTFKKVVQKFGSLDNSSYITRMLDDELRVGVSKEFKKLLHKKAAELNLSLSAYIRLVLTKASKKDIFE